MTQYTYYDSEAGNQTNIFDKLSELIKYIEDFPVKGDSIGIIYHRGEPILKYISENGNLYFERYEE